MYLRSEYPPERLAFMLECEGASASVVELVADDGRLTINNQQSAVNSHPISCLDTDWEAICASAQATQEKPCSLAETSTRSILNSGYV